MKTFSCPFQLGQICTYTYRIAHLKDPMYRLTWNNRKLDGILLNSRKKELSRNTKKKRKLKLSWRWMISQLNFLHWDICLDPPKTQCSGCSLQMQVVMWGNLAMWAWVDHLKSMHSAEVELSSAWVSCARHHHARIGSSDIISIWDRYFALSWSSMNWDQGSIYLKCWNQLKIKDWFFLLICKCFKLCKIFWTQSDRLSSTSNIFCKLETHFNSNLSQLSCRAPLFVISSQPAVMFPTG